MRVELDRDELGAVLVALARDWRERGEPSLGEDLDRAWVKLEQAGGLKPGRSSARSFDPAEIREGGDA